jgi:hypothetical protein
MKANLPTTLLLVSAMSSVSFAQFSNSNTSTYKPEVAAQGVKVSLLLPVLTAKSKFTGSYEENGITVKDSEKSSSNDFSTVGFALGYANLPVQSLGFVGQVAYVAVNPDESDVNLDMLRFEGNVGYAINQMFYLKGGLNLPTILTKELKGLDEEIGFQAGLGIQFNENLGLEFNYSMMNFETQDNTGDYSFRSELELSGLEIGLTGTF